MILTKSDERSHNSEDQLSFFAFVGERVSFDGRLLFPGLLVQTPCHDDGYVCVLFRDILPIYLRPHFPKLSVGTPPSDCERTDENDVKAPNKPNVT